MNFAYSSFAGMSLHILAREEEKQGGARCYETPGIGAIGKGNFLKTAFTAGGKTVTEL